MKKLCLFLILPLILTLFVLANEAPRFESLEFLTTALSDWKAGVTFSPDKLEYDLTIKTYSTTKLTLQKTTVYDTEKYDAFALYQNANGENVSVPINSGAITYLDGIPFGKTQIKITLTDKTDEKNQTVYVFNALRPRDTTKTVKASGITLLPEGRELSPAKYQSQPEGTFFKCDSSGVLTSGTGVASKQNDYRVFAIEKLSSFSLSFTATTAYTHIRYTSDEGKTYKELPQGGGMTDVISLPEAGAKVVFQLLDDKTFTENGGFSGTTNDYTVFVEQVKAGEPAYILSASADGAELFPALRNDVLSYSLIVPNGTKECDMTFTVSEGASVSLGKTALTPEDGAYKITLKTTAQTVDVTNKDGITNSYSLKLTVKSKYDGPDKIVDYLCPNSQYTNMATFGINIVNTLSGTTQSLGNFGGYVTYFFEKPLTNDPRNLFGLDFYVYGNANRDTSTATKMSFFEPGQVYVSEDGEKWYALAGSAHYDDGVLWDYSVTYSKTENGKTAWRDSLGNENDGSNGYAYILGKNYPLNSYAKDNSFTLSGVMLPSADGSVTGSGTTDAYAVNWGYCDALPNGTIGADANPYLDNESHALPSSGFDLAWAVDEKGTPLDVSAMEFHYVKVQTASNIRHNAFGEKSTEVTQILRTVPQSENVGKTEMPSGITVSQGSEKLVFPFSDESAVLDIGDMKYIDISVNGANESANIYINNQRTGANIRVCGEKLVRILVQDGDKEPYIRVLTLKSTATDTDTLLDGIKLDCSSNIRKAESKNGLDYTLSVGSAIDSVGIIPVCAADTEILINESTQKSSYPLTQGENTFAIKAAKGELSQEYTLTVTREKSAVQPDNNMTVYFTLLGDEKHGTNQTHTYANSKSQLKPWISRTKYTLPKGSTVLDLIKKACAEKGITFNNAGGNYIASVTHDGVTLGEFSNGPYSGWMYTLNGSYPERGIAEQTLASGNKVILHYTDDYREEQAFTEYNGISRTAVTPLVAQENDLAKTVAGKGLNFGSVGGEWAVLGLARSGEKVPESYFSCIENMLRSCKGILSETKYTEYSRLVVALTAINKDCTSIAGYDLISPLCDYDNVVKQGLNGPVWALIALDSANYRAKNNVRARYVDLIVSSQNEDGGFALSAKMPSDIDITAMALTALSNYRHISAVRDAVAQGVAYLSSCKNIGTSESLSQMLVAYATLGLPCTDVKEALLKYRVGDGFAHLLSDKKSNAMATEQAYYALCAFDRFEKGKNALFDMTKEHKPFSDCRERAVLILADSGIITGKSETVFDPGANLTRAEFCALVTRAFKLEGSEKTPFTDVNDEWFAPFVEIAYKNGIVRGVSKDKFAPNSTITYAEAAVMLARAVGNPSSSFAVNAPDWAKDGLGYCAEHAIVDGANAGDTITRLEAAHAFFYLLAL